MFKVLYKAKKKKKEEKEEQRGRTADNLFNTEKMNCCLSKKNNYLRSKTASNFVVTTKV